MKYRPEIDGLRALAVVPVILFHAGFSVASGGFVGVDVFFVISGYLIASLILQDLERGRFSILEFYERRARRIIPALAVVAVACIPIAWVWMLPQDFTRFARSVLALGLFASNILFWNEQGYFRAENEEKPLLHTWTLAVEEQFYVLFPLLLLLIWRWGPRRLFWILAGLATASLAVSEVGARRFPEASFFLLPMRAWELLAGALCAIAPRSVTMRRPGLLALAGIAMIGYATLTFDNRTPFPGLNAAIPVLGTVLVILFAAPGTIACRVLSFPLFVGIGLVSYSAYLWHQPLFAFARIILLPEPSTLLMLTLAGLSILLGYITWHFIEQPFRRRSDRWLPRRSVLLGSTVATLFAFVIAGLGLDNRASYLARLSPDQRALLSFREQRTSEQGIVQNRIGSCMVFERHGGLAAYDPERCARIDPDRLNVLLLGNSHASMYAQPLADWRDDVNLMQATSTGCNPLLPLKGDRLCVDLLGRFFHEFLAEHNVDAVILGARWPDSDVAQIGQTIEYLRKLVPQVIVMGPVPEYGSDLPLVLMQRGRDGIAVDDPALRPEPFELAPRMAAATADAGATYIDVIGIICPDGTCRTIAPDGQPMAKDYGHLTDSAARYVLGHLPDDLFARAISCGGTPDAPGRCPAVKPMPNQDF